MKRFEESWIAATREPPICSAHTGPSWTPSSPPLLERETLTREEFLAVMAGETLPELKLVDDSQPNEPSAQAPSKQSKQAMPPTRLEPGPA